VTTSCTDAATRRPSRSGVTKGGRAIPSPKRRASRRCCRSVCDRHALLRPRRVCALSGGLGLAAPFVSTHGGAHGRTELIAPLTRGRSSLGSGSGSGSVPGSGSIGVGGSCGDGTVAGSSGAAGVPGSGTAGAVGASGTAGVGGTVGWGTSSLCISSDYPGTRRSMQARGWSISAGMIAGVRW
jgi:hypothetical protein